jgi:YihY family inner membrane protein
MAAETAPASKSPSPQARFDEFQQRRPWLSFPLAVVKKNGDDGGGNLAALMAYFGFFSLFPLLLVFSTVLGFVLHDHPGKQASIENSVTKNFPSLGNLIHFNAIKGSLAALIIGVLTALYAGLGITNAAQNAMDTVWAVPRKNRASWIRSKLRGVTLLVSLGLLFVVSSFASGAVSSGFGGTGLKIAGYVISIIVNFGLYFISFRLMTESEVSSSDLWTGAAFGAVVWTILQSVGGYYLKHVSSGKSTTYGVFAVVIGLIIWLHLGAQIFLYSAEINVVRARRLWPRSFFGSPQTEADQDTLRGLAQIEQRHDEQQVDVGFDASPKSRDG